MRNNLYSVILNDWYQNRFNNYIQVKNTSKFIPNSPDFLKDYRSLSINLGRQQGASTAIAGFIKEHPELNIKIIFANHILAKEFSNKYQINLNRYKLFEDTDIENIDIIFIDDSSFRYMFTTKKQEDFYTNIISQLNTKNNINQWLISFC